ncbi:DUF1572 family protein, partial [Flavobacteriales bacterium AH-315-E23]|nr:DUF1572 family protein [Flavobacteriales bacterium AH-315-E23]
IGQWINTGLGGDVDNRTRQEEFDNRGEVSREEMLKGLSSVMDRAREVINGLGEKDLLAIHSVQGYRETGVSIIIHVVEHFSYHVGQVTYIVKSLKDIDTGYYSGKDLKTTAG